MALAQVETRVIADDEADLRLDRWFRRHFPALGHGRLEKLLRTGQVRLDGKRAKASTRLLPGQTVRVPPLAPCGATPRAGEAVSRPPAVSEAEREALRRALLHIDDAVIAIDKPAGLAVQGGSGQKRHLDAMLEALRFEAAERPRLVHRLDKDTSGVLLLARDRKTAQALTASFKSHAVEKTYWAAVVGRPDKPSGRIDAPLGKVAKGGLERVAEDAETARAAVTLYGVVKTWKRSLSWLVLRPLTGRTHQLRVHCAAIGHPIVGDGKYGGRAAFPADLPQAKQLHLHARELALPHPGDGTTLRITAPLPAHMARTWAQADFDVAAAQGAEARLDRLMR